MRQFGSLRLRLALLEQLNECLINKRERVNLKRSSALAITRIIAYLISCTSLCDSRTLCDGVGLRARCYTTIAWSLSALLACTCGHSEVADWWHLLLSSRTVTLRRLRLLGFFCGLGCCGGFGLSSGLGKELLEVFQKVWGSIEEGGNLCVDVLNRLRLSLISLKNFEELLVDFWSVLEAVLRRKLLLSRLTQ